MKKLFTVRFIWVCFVALTMLMVSQSARAEYVKLTALKGINNKNPENEYYHKLVDANSATKWFSWSDNGILYVIIKAEKAVVPNSYFLITGNDTGSIPARNWASWKIYGGNFDNDEQAIRNGTGWTLIDDRADVSLPRQNFATVDFEFNKNPTTAYKYYWIEITKTVGGNQQQMSEWGLGTYAEFEQYLDKHSPSVSTIIVNSETQPMYAGGYITNYSKENIIKKGLIVSKHNDDLFITDETSYINVGWPQPCYPPMDILFFDCTSVNEEEYVCALTSLDGNTDYYVKSFIVTIQNMVIYGDVEIIHTQNFNRFHGNGDIANVFLAFDFTLFDLFTDEIINPNDGFYYTTNENPTTVRYQVGTKSNVSYKFATEWNYKLWYHHNTAHCEETKIVSIPVMRYKNGKLEITKAEADADKDITIYYSINGDGTRPENFTQIYSEPLTVENNSIVYCYAISSDGYISETNRYAIRKYLIKNNLIYIVDGEVYKTYELEYGSPITPEDEPTKEGYTFSGWSEIPETMPDHDIVVTGNFIINSYTLTYKVDDEVFKTYEVEYNTPITPEPAPTKEGYTFSGWSGIPETMPAEDVTVTSTFIINQYTITFDTNGGSPVESMTQDYGSEITPPENPTKEGYTFIGWEPAIPETMPIGGLTCVAQWQINSYLLIYIVDGVEYSRSEVEYGAQITPLEEPTKEGYTFSGWTYIPSTMPATDVVVMGSFTINSYTLTYMVDGEEYKTSTVTYGSAITPEAEPTKEGYTFSGWSEILETMPAGDVVITGTFAPNSYTLSYVVDGEEYKTSSVAYGTTITPETEPTKEGYTFSGWSEIPATMPAEDVVITGSFTINQYLLTYVIDGEEYKSYNVDFNTALTPEPAPVKRGMTFSGWGEVPATMPAHDVTLNGTYSWSKETVDGVTYEVADTLNNYASVVGAEGEEVTILTEVDIDGYSYTVNSIADNALPKTITINTSVGRLLLWLWMNDYINILETETGRDLSAPELSLVRATASSLKMSFANDYPELIETVKVSASVVEKGANGYEVALTGLEPDYLYDGIAVVTLTFEDASYTKSYSFRTEPLTLTALQPKVVSLGNVIVAAESNLDDEETNVGFEWRRIDWTDDFESRSGAAFLYEGIMEGYIRSLNTDKLWKFRPYYTSNAGNTYYSDWKGMDPSDYSFFEPTVHTYAPISVTDSTAVVKGYAMQGTDDVASQGFMYWKNTSPASSRMRANGVPVDATVVEVPGHVMKTTLSDLEYDTEYSFVAFVRTADGQTFYGEQQSFRTNSDPDGIKDIKATEEVTEVARYDISGRMIGKPQKGINIIRYSDGTSKKVLVK